ncbi:MAG TPA: DJ-1/PfpI family protein [Sphingobacterium sp.]|jgi:protease I|nr:DJ-1/PfpI family protein [Sphingobacterium sp.]
MFQIAILLSDGFDEWAVKYSKPFFKKKGYTYQLISPKEGEFVRSWNYKDWGPSYAIDQHINETEVATYDALIMPGGALSVDNIRTDRSVLSFVQKFIDQDRVIGTLCHGVWPLLELGFVRSKRLTTVPTIRTDIVNAGGIWEDKPAVVDGNLVSSRTSEDLPAFHDALQRVLESRLQDAT